MPVKHLPSEPNLNHLKYQARDLLKQHAERDLGVAQRLREFHPHFSKSTDLEIFTSRLSLSDAQLAIAREYGFRSWPRLKTHVESPELSSRLNLPHHERIEDPAFRRAVELLDAGDPAALRDHLRRHPKLVHQHVEFEGGNYFRNPTLLEFIAENPVRRGTLPANIVTVAKAILDAGSEKPALNEALMLVSTGSVPRQCSVQVALIDLLCDYGANPEEALQAAALHGEWESVDTLLHRGAALTLPVAASLGRVEDFRRLLSKAEGAERHLALALAAQHGRVEIVRQLLDAGEDPNRYNPPGGHSHSTPLHQAALSGNDELVRLLIERGAKADIKDLLWQGTPADWARHEGRAETEAYLRPFETSKR